MSDAKFLADGDYGPSRPLEAPTRTQSRPPVLPPPRYSARRKFNWNWVTFLLVVVAPTALATVYLFGYASDQYVSEFRFRLRHAQPSRLETSSPLAGLTGATAVLETMTDSEIVVEYLQSRQVLDDIRNNTNIDRIYGDDSADWYSRLRRGAPVEDQLRYWRKMADPFFDSSTGIVTVKVRAFNPADARDVAMAMLHSSEKLVNNLSERAQADKLEYARKTVADKTADWKNAEAALRRFRNANDVMFPNMQANESVALDGGLRASESRVRAALDALRLQGISLNAPQARTLQAQLESIESEIRRTQSRVTRNDTTASAGDPQSLASLSTAYDALDVEAKIASKAYELAVMAAQQARDEANQQQVYLDAFVQPAIAEKSTYPMRWRSVLQVGFASFAVWCLGMLLWRAVMDHID